MTPAIILRDVWKYQHMAHDYILYNFLGKTIIKIKFHVSGAISYVCFAAWYLLYIVSSTCRASLFPPTHAHCNCFFSGL
jgi:hypothetical protein